MTGFFFFHPTIEVATSRLHGLCMLGVILLPAFTRLGHECQDLLSPCDGMHNICAYTRPRFILSSERVVLLCFVFVLFFLFCFVFVVGGGGGGGVRTYVNSKGKIPSTGKILLRGGSNPRRCIKQDREPKTLPTSYSGRRSVVKSCITSIPHSFPIARDTQQDHNH